MLPRLVVRNLLQYTMILVLVILIVILIYYNHNIYYAQVVVASKLVNQSNGCASLFLVCIACTTAQYYSVYLQLLVRNRIIYYIYVVLLYIDFHVFSY